MIRTYSELKTLTSFEDRFNYLRLDGSVGIDTFGFDRYMNQQFYRSKEWKDIRNHVIIRDNGCDLGVEGYEIHGRILIHHINPIRPQDIIDASEYLMNPEYLITTVLNTHNAIHYGDDSSIIKKPVERTMNDTCPWRRQDRR